MKLYNYQVEHSTGASSGLIAAKSLKAAKEELTKQYTQTVRVGKKNVKSEITLLKVEEAKSDG